MRPNGGFAKPNNLRDPNINQTMGVSKQKRAIAGATALIGMMMTMVAFKRKKRRIQVRDRPKYRYRAPLHVTHRAQEFNLDALNETECREFLR